MNNDEFLDTFTRYLDNVMGQGTSSGYFSWEDKLYDATNFMSASRQPELFSSDFRFRVRIETEKEAHEVFTLLYKLVDKTIIPTNLIEEFTNKLNNTFTPLNSDSVYLNLTQKKEVDVRNSFNISPGYHTYTLGEFKCSCRFFPSDIVYLGQSGITGRISRVIFNTREKKFQYSLLGDDTLMWDNSDLSLCQK